MILDRMRYFSLDFEECAHKILKMNIKPGQEVCDTIILCVTLFVSHTIYV